MLYITHNDTTNTYAVTSHKKDAVPCIDHIVQFEDYDIDMAKGAASALNANNTTLEVVVCKNCSTRRILPVNWAAISECPYCFAKGAF